MAISRFFDCTNTEASPLTNSRPVPCSMTWTEHFTRCPPSSGTVSMIWRRVAIRSPRWAAPLNRTLSPPVVSQVHPKLAGHVFRYQRQGQHAVGDDAAEPGGGGELRVQMQGVEISRCFGVGTQLALSDGALQAGKSVKLNPVWRLWRGMRGRTPLIMGGDRSIRNQHRCLAGYRRRRGDRILPVPWLSGPIENSAVINSMPPRRRGLTIRTRACTFSPNLTARAAFISWRL